MDTEKGFQPDTSFQDQPYWASCHTCRATQKKPFIIKSIFGLLLLGLLALNSYQSIHTLPTKLSSLQPKKHNAISIDVEGHHNLSLTIQALPSADDPAWAFTAFTKDGCAGKATNPTGNATLVACQPFNQPYEATSVAILDQGLKICLYPDNLCSGVASELTSTTDCQNVATSAGYRVLSSSTSCQLEFD